MEERPHHDASSHAYMFWHHASWTATFYDLQSFESGGQHTAESREVASRGKTPEFRMLRFFAIPAQSRHTILLHVRPFLSTVSHFRMHIKKHKQQQQNITSMISAEAVRIFPKKDKQSWAEEALGVAHRASSRRAMPARPTFVQIQCLRPHLAHFWLLQGTFRKQETVWGRFFPRLSRF